MQEWLGNNDILMYSTHNEGKSIIAERFITNDSKPYWNKLVDQYNNTYHHSINKKPITLSQILKLLNLK